MWEASEEEELHKFVTNMALINPRDDPHRFVHYHQNQVGGTLPGFYGAPVMSGRRKGSRFSKWFRFVSPLVKAGFAIARPHLKKAATNIASDVKGKAMSKITSTSKRVDGQAGSGTLVLSRRASSTVSRSICLSEVCRQRKMFYSMSQIHEFCTEKVNCAEFLLLYVLLFLRFCFVFYVWDRSGAAWYQ